MTSEGQDRPLARISHILSAADADCGPSASLRSFGLLDVGSTTPSSASLRAPCIRATLCVLATRGCEKCGLALSRQLTALPTANCQLTTDHCQLTTTSGIPD